MLYFDVKCGILIQGHLLNQYFQYDLILFLSRSLDSIPESRRTDTKEDNMMKSTAKPIIRYIKRTALLVTIAVTLFVGSLFMFSVLNLVRRESFPNVHLFDRAENYQADLLSVASATCTVVSPVSLVGNTIITTVGVQLRSVSESISFFRGTRSMIIMGIVAGCGFIVLLAVFIVTRRRSKAQLMRLAYIDSLTGCRNYMAFQKEASVLLAKNQRYALILFDVNRFKAINNTYGFKEGNKLLIFVSKKVQDFIADDETCSRVSDDNFTILLRYESDEQLRSRLGELFAGMKQFLSPYGNNMIELNYACGVYVIVNRELPLDYCHENAQMAKQSVKELYDTTVSFYDDTFRQQVIETQVIEASMYQGLENNEFEIYLQPKYDLRTEEVAGAEALIRWHHPTLGFLTPNRFIPIFEHNGFLLKLDCYVYEKVCSLLQSWIESGATPIPISVNMSRLHVRQRNFVEDLERMVNSHGVPAELIEIELTENAFFEDTQQIIDVMEQLKSKGFKLSMDDFGSGYSSLNLLNMLPVDTVKLDRMMFTETTKAERSKKVAANAIHIVRDLEMTAVAEGIETQEQVDFLKHIDCDMVQGYFYAKPMPVYKFEQLAYNRVG